MPRPELSALVETDAERPECRLILAPRPARLREVVGPGDYLEPGKRLALAEVLRTRYALVVPEGVRGCVVERLVPDRETAVAYRDPLLRLGESLTVLEEAGGSHPAAAGAAGTGAGSLRITAPSDGIFYRRPDPESPPYVSEGDTIETGAVLGLVEVMKCFNQIRYGGAAMPARARILSIRAADAAEVSAGQILIELEPA